LFSFDAELETANYLILEQPSAGSYWLEAVIWQLVAVGC